MTTIERGSLEGIERLLVDGNNLLHAIRRRQDPAPQATLVGRIRAAIPANIRIEIVFDGRPDPRSRNVRVASGVTVHFSGRISADALLVRLVSEAAPTTIEPAARILVVTDDIDLGRDLRRHGAGTAGTAWLIRRISRSASPAPSVGRRRPPQPTAIEMDDEPDRRRWNPGRGATRKRGNPRRGHDPAGPRGG